MTWGFGTGIGSATEKTSGDTAISWTVTVAVAAGNILAIRVGSDNLGTVDGDRTDVTVTDSKGNTYVRAVEYDNTVGGAAGDGAKAAIFLSKITTALTTSDTITVTWATAVTAKNAQGAYFTVAAGKTYQVDQVLKVPQDGTTAPSASFSGLSAIERAFITALSKEGPTGDTFTADPDYTELGSPGTSGGAAATNNQLHGGRRIATETGNTYNPTLGTARDVCTVGVALSEVSQGQSAAVGTSSETDTAPAVGRAKARSAAVSTEADTAPPAGRAKALVAATATETDTAPAIGRAKAAVLGTATETDQALEITRPGHFVAVGTATETDTAPVVSRAKSLGVGTATETETAPAIAGIKARALVAATEAATAPAVGRAKARAAGTAGEAETAPGVLAAKARALGAATEANTAPAVSSAKARALPMATEADAALLLGRAKALALAIVTELDVAPSIGRAKGVVSAAALETDEAPAITRAGDPVPVGTATETDQAPVLGRSKARAAGTAGEADQASPITRYVEPVPAGELVTAAVTGDLASGSATREQGASGSGPDS